MYNYTVKTYKSKSELISGLNEYGKQGWRAISIQRFETHEVGVMPYFWDVIYEKELKYEK